jgi:hypothetical protein
LKNNEIFYPKNQQVVMLTIFKKPWCHVVGWFPLLVLSYLCDQVVICIVPKCTTSTQKLDPKIIQKNNGCWFVWMDQKYHQRGIFSMFYNVINMWNTNSHKKIFLAKWKSYSWKWKDQRCSNKFSWNLTKVVVWIYLWGGNTCLKVLYIMFGSENFERISFNWG